MTPLHSLPIHTDENLTETKFVQYRPDRFIEYEETDARILYEGWAEFRQVPSTKVYQIGGKLLMHPMMLEMLKQEISGESR